MSVLAGAFFVAPAHAVAPAFIANIDVGNSPQELAVNTVTHKVYVPDEADDTVTVIDGLTNAILKVIPVGNFPFCVAINEKTNRIYVSNVQQSSITVIDGSDDTIITNVTRLLLNQEGAAVNSETNRLYFGDNTTIKVLNTLTNSVIVTIPATAIGTGFYNPVPQSATVNEATNAFYFCLVGENAVARFDGVSNQETAMHQMGSLPRECRVNPVTNRLYVVTDDGYLTMLDGTTLNLLKRVKLHMTGGAQIMAPFLTLDTGTNEIYTGNNDDSFSIWDGDTLEEKTKVQTTRVGGIAFDPVSGRVYLSNFEQKRVSVFGYPETGEQPTASINDVSVTEGTSGTQNATFTVTLSAPSSRPITVNYATSDGTAQEPGDYTATSGSLLIPARTLAKTVTVPITTDADVEDDETFSLKLSQPVNATLNDDEGVATIRNDDFPSFSINDVSVKEGNTGTTQASFTVTLSPPLDKTVTVNYATADDTALAGSDYIAASGTLTFEPGATSRRITVAVIGNTATELDERFFVNLSANSDTELADSQGIGVIVNDDEEIAPTVAIVSPANGSAARTMPVVNGTASDNEGGSGLSKVQVRLRRIADNKYWNGVTWGVSTELTTSLGGGGWRKVDGWPAGSNLPEGAYTLAAIAYDRSGNTATVSSGFKIDTTVPTSLVIKSPANGAVVRSLSSISGSATDNINGSGLGSVKLRLQRGSDHLYWNGITWGRTSVLLSGTASGVSWSRKGELPTGFDLQDGSYAVTASIYDKAGNSISATSIFRVDVTSPDTLIIATPAAGSGVKNLISVTGFAADGEGGSGLASVKLRLRKNIGNVYWTGTEWGTATNLDAEIAGTSWSKNSGWPTGDDLGEDGYVLYAVATDKAGNSNTITTSFKVDRTAPATIVIKTPKSGATIGALGLVSGTTADNSGGSGVDTVHLRLRRSDNKFWTGSTWDAATDLDAIVIGYEWSKAGGWPSGVNLTTDEYQLTATAVDRAGNSTSVTSTFKVDATPPATLTILTPANGSTVGALTSVTGTATDDAGGSGIVSVKLRLCRLGDNLYWIGTEWGASITLDGTVFGSQWSKTRGWPTGDKLPDGEYQLFVTALDKAGNSRETSSVFSVEMGPVVRSLPTSSVMLSSASARSADGGATVRLTFTGALGSSATDAGRYTVSVDGAPLNIVSVQQPTASEAVLSVDGAKRGQALLVSYNLLDGQGKATTGTITVPVK